MKLLLVFDNEKAFKWFCNTIERDNALLIDAEQIPFDVIYFGFLYYIVALYEHTFTIVKERENLVFPKSKKVYPCDILKALKSNNIQIVSLVDELHAAIKSTKVQQINNYFKHSGMPYTRTTSEKSQIVFHYENNSGLSKGYCLSTLKQETKEFYLTIIDIVNRILDYYQLELLNTELTGTTDKETNQLSY
ncbi:MAG: hypothetical protein MUF78_07080 [Candidatus Edwardsbacteria bacterium]|nr:hypothetical protein [Candidatus Edwardsbacteria bacterium]